MNNKKKICIVALVGALAVSTMGIGLASWKTEITANGNVSANSQWDVVITDANIRTSTGASVENAEFSPELVRSGLKGDDTIVASICSGNWVEKENESLIGTQDTTAAMSATTHFYAVDTTKHDISGITTWDRAAVTADETTVNLADALKYRYYANAHGYENIDSEERAAKTAEWKSLVMDGFLKDTTAVLKAQYPDTYQNYAVVSLVGWSSIYYTIAEMSTMPMAVISEDQTSAEYEDVTFGLPGAWAEYSLTVTNKGSVDANLADAVIELATEQPEQLTLAKPDLADEVLKAGESCTITFVVQVPESVTDDLNASGTLTVKLPYGQTTVEDAPDASHTHNN